MLWVAAAAVALAVLVRFLMRRERLQVWWIAFTVGLGGATLGTLAIANESDINRLFATPNIAYVVSEFAFVMGGAGTVILVHTLRRSRPSGWVIATHSLIALAICTAIGIAWQSAPLHSGNWPTFRDIPIYPQALAYGWLFNLYQSAVLANNLVCCTKLAAEKTAVHDPTRRVALIVFALAAALGIVSQVLYLVRLAVPQPNRLVSVLKAIADMAGPLDVLLFGLGAALLVLGPAVLAIYRDRRLSRQLRPLWLRLQEVQPSSSKPRAITRVHRRPSHQLERMLIEISDGLSLLQVPQSAPGDPETVIASVLRTNGRNADADPTTNALAMLGITNSRLDEERQLLGLAQVYSRLTAGEAEPVEVSTTLAA